MHAKLGEDFLTVGQNIHQVGHGRALIAANVSDTGLKQSLGDGQNALPVEYLPRAEAQLFYFFGERTFGHDYAVRAITRRGLPEP